MYSGFEPSKPIKLDIKPGSEKEFKLTHVQSYNLNIIMSRQPNYSVGSQLHVIFYVKAWIVNHTGLPLWYNYGKLAGCEGKI